MPKRKAVLEMSHRLAGSEYGATNTENPKCDLGGCAVGRHAFTTAAGP